MHRTKTLVRKIGKMKREDGDTMRENKAMHEESFLSIWLREDGRGETKREMEVDKEVGEGVGNK